MLTDDSAGEQRAVAATFPGPRTNGQVGYASSLSQTFSCNNTGKINVKTLDPVTTALRSALYNRQTDIGCEQSLQEAINAAPAVQLK